MTMICNYCESPTQALIHIKSDNKFACFKCKEKMTAYCEHCFGQYTLTNENYEKDLCYCPKCMKDKTPEFIPVPAPDDLPFDHPIVQHQRGIACGSEKVQQIEKVGSSTIIANKNIDMMCLPRAIKYFVEEKMKDIIMSQVAISHLKRKGLIDDKVGSWREIMKTLAVEKNCTIIEVLKSICAIEFTEQAIELILDIHNKAALQAHRAKFLDHQLKSEGGVSNYTFTLEQSEDGTFCLMSEDDEFLPF